MSRRQTLQGCSWPPRLRLQCMASESTRSCLWVSRGTSHSCPSDCFRGRLIAWVVCCPDVTWVVIGVFLLPAVNMQDSRQPCSSWSPSMHLNGACLAPQQHTSLQRRLVHAGRSVGLSVGALAAGILLGAAVNAWLRVDIVPIGVSMALNVLFVPFCATARLCKD